MTKEAKKETPEAPWWQVSFRSSTLDDSSLLGAAVVQADYAQSAIEAARSGATDLRWCVALANELPDRVLRVIAPENRCRLLAPDEAFWLTRYVTMKLATFRARAAAAGHPRSDEEHAEPQAAVDPDLLRTQLEPGEEAPLRWYWGEGATLSERSTMGPMVENHAAYSIHAIEYENALRAGKVRLEHGKTFERLGWEPIEYGLPGREAIYDDIGRFTGEYEDTREAVLNRAGAVIGYSEQATVEITAECVSSSGYEPDGEDIGKKADISQVLRAMMVLREHDGLTAFDVLRVLYGPEGEHWNMLKFSGERAFKAHGRIASLYPSTRAGKRLLRWDDELRLGSGRPVSDLRTQARMELLVKFSVEPVNDEWKVPTDGAYANIKQSDARKTVRLMLDMARSEASIANWRACHAWRAAVRGSGEKMLKRRFRP